MSTLPTVVPARKARAYVYLISMVAAVSGLLFGFDTAVINGALLFLRVQFRLSDVQTEVAAGSLLVGCMVGSAFAGALSDAWGRRRTLLIAALLFCAATLGSALPRDLSQFVAARALCGIAIGVASVLAPMYIAEVSPAAIRGRLVSLNQLAIVSGILGAYFVNWRLASLGDDSWRWMFAVAGLPSVALFLGILLIPESPRWLMKRGREERARAVLERVSGPEEAERETLQIRATLSAEASMSMRDLLRPGLRKALGIAITLAVLQQVTGINTVLYYGAILFREMAGAADAGAALAANITIGLVNLVCTVLSLFLIDRVGRRPLFIGGAAGMALSLFALGAAFRMEPRPAGLILGLILVYIACFALSLGPGVWVYIAEIFPTAIRGRAMSVATLALWSACLAVTLTFLSLIRIFSAAGTFWGYGCVCVLCAIFVWLAVPETRGRTLEEIDRQWRR